MRKLSKRPLIVILGVMVLILTYVIYQNTMKGMIATTFSKVQYVVLESECSVQKVKIGESTSNEISEKIMELASIKILGKKSVSYGRLSMFDKEKKLIARMGILEYPFFTFNGTQVEFRYDIVAALGFSLSGYSVPPSR